MSNPVALIIEDHAESATIFAEALREAGFETEIIHSGEIALSRLAVVTPDVVLLDLNLPRVAGTDILHQIRADPRLAKTRVIVATAYPELAEDIQDEADLVLFKPVSFSQLRSLAARLDTIASVGE
jgi:CheY-like chemotaxis protein